MFFLEEAMTSYRRNAAFKAQFAAVAPALADGRFTCLWEDRWPCFEGYTYTFSAHYGYHTSWAARVLARLGPARHVDIGSCLRFVSLVSAFIPMDFYDYRPVELTLAGLTVNHADITALPFMNESVNSLSCMHVVEHIGLGRYGEPIDPEGDLKAMRELARVLAPGGTLLFVVPVGKKAVIRFNAHRIYTPELVESGFTALKLCEFSYISNPINMPERLILNASAKDIGGDVYGCGCFHFTRQ